MTKVSKKKVLGPFVVSQGQYFIFGALCPSKSGLMNKHIVKHIVKHTVTFRIVGGWMVGWLVG